MAVGRRSFLRSSDGDALSEARVFLTHGTTGINKSFGIANLNDPTADSSVAWNGVSYSDGSQVTMGAAGEILHGPSDIDRYLAHVIHSPGGINIPLTQSEFLSRAMSSPEKNCFGLGD